MIKIPVLNRFTTDDQKFYDTQVNEELKYCACSNYVIQFIDVGKNKRAILITTGKNKLFALGFMKHDYSGINEALATLRLNLALAEKERSDDSNAEISVYSTKPVSGEQKENEIEALTIISSLDELLIDNKPLRKKEDVIRKLIELAMQNENGESYLDFYKAGYDKGIQNYLAMSLYDEDITVNDKVINVLAFFKSKDPKIYHLVNSFMRGNFDEMFSYMKSMEEKISTRDVIRISQNIIQAQEELPKRSQNLMIYRVGLGVNKDKNVGAENTYEAFVSLRI